MLKETIQCTITTSNNLICTLSLESMVDHMPLFFCFPHAVIKLWSSIDRIKKMSAALSFVCSIQTHLSNVTLVFGFTSRKNSQTKSYNVLKLNNGQFALQPNNRCRFYDPALNPREMKFPDFRVATRKYRVEQAAKWRLGDTSTVTYDDRSEA